MDALLREIISKDWIRYCLGVYLGQDVLQVLSFSIDFHEITFVCQLTSSNPKVNLV